MPGSRHGATTTSASIKRAHYAFLRKELQVLSYLRGPNRWVLKTPQHLEQLGPLLRTFPDATIAFTLRDPVAVLQSALTMLAYGDRVRRGRSSPTPSPTTGSIASSDSCGRPCAMPT